MKYSLANYSLSIDPNDELIKQMFGTLTVGGEGNYLESMTLSYASAVFSTQGYATGGWVHDKNLDRHGTVSITLNQLSDKVAKFIQLVKLSLSGDYEGFTLSLSDVDGNKIATCVDCYISQIPEQSFASTSQTQTWSFTCGQINFD